MHLSSLIIIVLQCPGSGHHQPSSKMLRGKLPPFVAVFVGVGTGKLTYLYDLAGINDGQGTTSGSLGGGKSTLRNKHERMLCCRRTW